MEETIHINVELIKTEAGHLALTKSRLWPPLLRFTRTLVKGPMRGNLIDGICLTILSNLAIVVEGFITDIILEEIKRTKSSSFFNPDISSWKKKKKTFVEVFQKDIEVYKEYESINILFLLRNNLAHGRSHSEISKPNNGMEMPVYVESENKNYQVVRNYLVANKLLNRKVVPSNVDLFWQPLVSVFFNLEVERFLFSVINDLDTKYYEGILSELKTACEMK